MTHMIDKFESLALALLAAAIPSACHAQVDGPPAESAPMAASAASAANAAQPPGTLPGGRDCRPTYPAAARAGAEGQTGLRFTIDATGRLVKAEITHPSGPKREHHLLDMAALSAFSTCEFRAGKDASGQPVEGVFDVVYT